MIKPLVRLVLAISLDGRLAFSSGGKANLGGVGDRKALEEALAWADATLIGSGTLKIHQNTCLIHNSELINRRQLEGRSSQPLALVVTTQASFSKQWEFFQQPIKRWLLSSKSSQNLLCNEGFDRHVLMKDSWEETFKELEKLGCSKIVLLGGIKLIKSILLEDKIDELQLTLTPRILAGKYTWTPTTLSELPIQLTKSTAWTLKGLNHLGNNEVLVKYFRNRS